MDNFGEILKEKRRECNISQGELAEKIGVHPQTVSKWERGKMLPDVGQFGDIANALGIPLEDVLNVPLGEKYYTGKFSVEALSASIIQLRGEKNLSRSDVAETVHYSVDSVSRWERGVTCPDIDCII
ncbi:MAG: helix-turn-helix domain-containing protein, partial [Candidatus Neoclostridium sp.]